MEEIKRKLSKVKHLKEYIDIQLLELEKSMKEASIDETKKLIDDTVDKVFMYVDCVKDSVTKIDGLEDQRERMVLFERYINGKTFNEISDFIGYKQRKVYQLHASGLNSLM